MIVTLSLDLVISGRENTDDQQHCTYRVVEARVELDSEPVVVAVVGINMGSMSLTLAPTVPQMLTAETFKRTS